MPEDTEENEKDTVYDEKGREELLEGGEISSEEEGFMRGYEESDDEKEEKKEEE